MTVTGCVGTCKTLLLRWKVVGEERFFERIFSDFQIEGIIDVEGLIDEWEVDQRDKENQNGSR